MSRPTTRASNANKHPGQVVLDSTRVQQSRDAVAAEKKQKQGEKDAWIAAVDSAHTKIAAKEDDMAIWQNAQLTGPPKLIQPRQRIATQTRSAQPIPAKAKPPTSTTNRGQSLVLYISSRCVWLIVTDFDIDRCSISCTEEASKLEAHLLRQCYCQPQDSKWWHDGH